MAALLTARVFVISRLEIDKDLGTQRGIWKSHVNPGQTRPIGIDETQLPENDFWRFLYAAATCPAQFYASVRVKAVPRNGEYLLTSLLIGLKLHSGGERPSR